jgi:hypothetical protein
MLTFPEAIPVTTPVAAPIDARPGLPLVHVPLGVVLLKVIVVAGHNTVGPVIAAGTVLTVTG